MIEITTLNVRGIKQNAKHKEMWLYFNKMKADIIILQETHSVKEDEVVWNAEFDSKILYSHGESNARGVAILFKPKLNVQIAKTTIDKNGRYIIADCTINDKPITLVNIYAPNSDEPQFFLDIFDKVSQHAYADRIFAGDFNLIINKQLDTVNRKGNNEKALKVLNAYIEEAMLIDVWREHNGNKFEFTYRKSKPEEMFARLDYVFVNQGLTSQIIKIKHKPAYKMDHCSVNLSLETNVDFKRGPGHWKLNESIMYNIENVRLLNNKVDEVVKIAERENYNDSYLWERLKEELTKECQNISKKHCFQI